MLRAIYRRVVRWFSEGFSQLEWLERHVPNGFVVGIAIPFIIGFAGMGIIIGRNLFPGAIWSRALATIGWFLALAIGGVLVPFSIEGHLVGWFHRRRISRRHNKHVGLSIV